MVVRVSHGVGGGSHGVGRVGHSVGGVSHDGGRVVSSSHWVTDGGGMVGNGGLQGDLRDTLIIIRRMIQLKDLSPDLSLPCRC